MKVEILFQNFTSQTLREKGFHKALKII